jgi:four helix bundle protein
MSIRSYRDLVAWQKAIALAKAVYIACESFPKNETYGLSSQVKRSVVSVAANLAEGHSRETTRDFLRFINIAYGSLSETETHLILANELGMISMQSLEDMLEQSAEIGRILNGLSRSLKEKLTDPRPLTPEPL